MPSRTFLVYSRSDCGLCAEFIAELSLLAVDFEVKDVDADPVARRRFGLKIPVLTCDGSVVCHGQLDVGAVERLARS